MSIDTYTYNGLTMKAVRITNPLNYGDIHEWAARHGATLTIDYSIYKGSLVHVHTDEYAFTMAYGDWLAHDGDMFLSVPHDVFTDHWTKITPRKVTEPTPIPPTWKKRQYAPGGILPKGLAHVGGKPYSTTPATGLHIAMARNHGHRLTTPMSKLAHALYNTYPAAPKITPATAAATEIARREEAMRKKETDIDTYHRHMKLLDLSGHAEHCDYCNDFTANPSYRVVDNDPHYATKGGVLINTGSAIVDLANVDSITYLSGGSVRVEERGHVRYYQPGGWVSVNFTDTDGTDCVLHTDGTVERATDKPTPPTYGMEGVKKFMDAAAGYDPVHKPRHYNDHYFFTGECWDYLADLPTIASHAFKYAWRVLDKDNPTQDAEKIKAYAGKMPAHVTRRARRAHQSLATQRVDNIDAYQELTARQQAAVDLCIIIANPHSITSDITAAADRLITALGAVDA